METTETDDKLRVLESLLNDARNEAEDLREQLDHYQRIVRSTRLIMGHELKKPTTAISGYLDLVCEDLEKSNALATLTYVEKAKSECDLLNELNSFYLDLLRIDAEGQKVGSPRVDIADVIDDVIADFPGKMDARHRVRVVIEDNVTPVSCNRNVVKLIVMNLIENALLYSQVVTPVRVEVELSPDKRGMYERELLKLRVSDNGVGIPETYLKRVFSPFVRLREDIAEGSGLGLTLVRSLVELSGGEIFVRSEKGEGTTVHVTLPAFEFHDEGAETGI